jgi:molybdopterin synthase sulfur carrier subunit
MPVVRIPTPLRAHAGGKDALEAPGATVGEVLNNLAVAHPDLGRRILEDGEVRGFVNVYLNDEDIRFLDELATAVALNDEISIIPAIAGG